MLFNTVEYWLFFFAVLAIFYSLPFRFGKVFLLGASYVFYMRWDARFVVLILASTVIDYTLGRLLEAPELKRRKLLLVVSLVANLGLLGFFKYYNFFAASLADLLRIPENSFALAIILPVGISFYTFASLSYTIDVYWGKMKAVRNFVDYAFFVAFFPHLIAGPIVRARQFISQITNWARPSAFVVQEGIMLVLSGLVKKMVFADRFAMVANEYFNHLSLHPGWFAAWSGLFAFTMQAYFDFSGYTDIARGCAKLLGFEFPLNFLRPLLAVNIAQFWRRWHMSLSAWVRDYVYIPLGGSRCGRARTYRNLMVAMLLVGLWHGASWNFVVWGFIMGGALIVHRLWRETIPSTSVERFSHGQPFVFLSVLLTFAVFAFSLAFLRAPTFPEALIVIHAAFNFHAPPGDNLLTFGHLALTLISVVLAAWEERAAIITRLVVAPVWMRASVYAIVFLSLELFSVTNEKVPFIYFQF